MSQDSCPADIILLISSHLDSASKKELCLVSQYFHSIFAPIVLQKIRILFCQENGLSSESIDERLRACQGDLSNIYKYARFLRANTKGYYVTRNVTPSLLPALWEAIARMTSLKSLELEWERYDNEKMETIMEYQDRIVQSVRTATGDQLDQLVLRPASHSPTLPASLQRIRGLRTLRVVHDENGWACSAGRWFFDDPPEAGLSCGCHRPWMDDVIKPLIAANPDLETLEIKQGCRNQGPAPHDVLPKSLTNLTSLTISGLNIPSIPEDGIPLVHLSPLQNLRHLTVRAAYGKLNMDAFWGALNAAKPPLETFISYHVSSAMINYLSSFSGLHSIELKHIKETDDCDTSDLSSSFLKQALPRHAETLERLAIDYDPDVYVLPGWDFDPITWSPALSHLSRLQYLALFPPVSPEVHDSNCMSGPQIKVSYQTILDNVMDLPNLHTLKINFPQPTFGCGTGYMRWSSSVSKMLRGMVPEFRVKGGRPEVLELFNGKQFCMRLVGEAGEVGEEWGYSPKQGTSKLDGIEEGDYDDDSD